MTAHCGPALLPAVLALASALLFAVGIQLAQLGLRHTDSQTAALIQIGSSTIVYWIGAAWFVEPYYWLLPVTALFAAIGIFRPFLSANLALAGTKLLGPTISSTLSSTSPLFGVALGVFALGEALTAPVLAGTVGIAAGVAVLSWKGEQRRAWVWWALALPIGAALLRALAQMLAKLGMESLPSPFFVGLVGYSVSFAVALVNSRRGGNVSRAVLTPGLKWLVAMGVVNGLSILSLNTALLCGRLVVVSPIVACSPLFSLALGLLVFREESITPRVAVAVLLVVPSVVVISAIG